MTDSVIQHVGKWILCTAAIIFKGRCHSFTTTHCRDTNNSLGWQGVRCDSVPPTRWLTAVKRIVRHASPSTHGRRVRFHSYAILVHEFDLAVWLAIGCTNHIAECVLIVYITHAWKCSFCNLIGATCGLQKSDITQNQYMSEARPSSVRRQRG